MFFEVVINIRWQCSYTSDENYCAAEEQTGLKSLQSIYLHYSILKKKIKTKYTYSFQQTFLNSSTSLRQLVDESVNINLTHNIALAFRPKIMSIVQWLQRASRSTYTLVWQAVYCKRV